VLEEVEESRRFTVVRDKAPESGLPLPMVGIFEVDDERAQLSNASCHTWRPRESRPPEAHPEVGFGTDFETETRTGATTGTLVRHFRLTIAHPSH